jgi:pimeloyl-ACP methyl ester carboxylesterase
MAFTTTSDGVRIAYESAGDGPLNVIFQHGWASTGAHFDLLRKELPLKGRRFAWLDLAGHGASEDSATAHTVESYAKQMLAVANALGMKNFVTVGHSMGAKYALYLRTIAAERLQGQISIAPTPAGLVQEEASDEIIAQYSSLSGSVPGMVQAFKMLITAPVSDVVVNGWAERAARIPAHVLASSMRAFARTDFEKQLDNSGRTPPMLVIAGAKDPIYPGDKIGARVSRETPNASFRLLDCGHDVPNELPYETALMVDGFLAGVAHS